MKKPKHYLETNPIKDWKIAEDVERTFIGTKESAERWEKIVAKNKPIAIVSTPTIANFKQYLN
jgi:hypothetical protein